MNVVTTRTRACWFQISVISASYLLSCTNLRDVTNRGYYTAAWRYKISLRVLKKISRVSAAYEWNIFSTREEKFHISKRPCNVLFIIKTPMKYKTISLQQIFGVKGTIYYEAIATVIFSHVKITCYFHMWRYQVFTRKLTWYFTGVYIIIRVITTGHKPHPSWQPLLLG